MGIAFMVHSMSLVQQPCRREKVEASRNLKEARLRPALIGTNTRGDSTHWFGKHSREAWLWSLDFRVQDCSLLGTRMI